MILANVLTPYLLYLVIPFQKVFKKLIIKSHDNSKPYQKYGTFTRTTISV